MDNFREWLSDNLRYFMLGGAILLIVAVLFFGVRACVGSGKGTSDKEQNTVQDNSQGNDPSSPEDDGETNDGKKEEDTNPLEEGSAEITALMKSYYQALGERDITTLKTLVSNLTPSDESRITNAKDYIEGYQVDNVYEKKGLDEDSYVVYTRGSLICKGIDTPAPSLWSSYIVKESDGSYRILGDLEQNKEVSDYMDSLKSDTDVQKLTSEVQAAYEQAQKADTALAQFLNGLGEEVDSTTQQDGTTMTVAEGCNVRSAANSDEDNIIGGLDEGDEVQVLGQEGDWVQIEYDGQTGYVYSGLLQ
mgnify:FL=1